MRCFQIYFSGEAAFQRRGPASDADAPFIARLHSRKSILRSGRHQIVSVQDREIEEVSINQDTDGVKTDVFRTGAAIAIAIKSGHRIAATAAQLCTEDVSGHGKR